MPALSRKRVLRLLYNLTHDEEDFNVIPSILYKKKLSLVSKPSIWVTYVCKTNGQSIRLSDNWALLTGQSMEDAHTPCGWLKMIPDEYLSLIEAAIEKV